MVYIGDEEEEKNANQAYYNAEYESSHRCDKLL